MSADDVEDYYVLKAEGQHEQDVKSVVAVPSNATSAARPLIASASRDRTVRTWSGPMIEEDILQAGLTFAGHEGFVNTVAFHPSAPFFGNVPVLLSGSQDTHIIAWSMETGMMLGVLDGHTKPVKSIAVLPNGEVVSGSWDHTVAVWDRNGFRRLVFSKHTNAVTCVVSTGDLTTVLSASGDRTVKLWNITTGEELKSFAGHSDAIQAVAMLDSSSFVSVGNDCCLCVWNLDDSSAPQRIIPAAHDAFIYAVALKPDGSGEFVTCSEDRTVKVWDRKLSNIQSIKQPRLVWSLCYLQRPDGEGYDLVTASEEGIIRLWTKDIGEMASQGTMDMFTKLVEDADSAAAAAAANNSGGGGGSSGVPPAHTLQTIEEVQAAGVVGSTEGEKKFVRNGTDVDVYLWSANQWERLGTVTSGPSEAGTITTGGGGGGPKRRGPQREYRGRKYDYVFDVDMNGTPLQLPYNAGQNIYDAAEMFMMDNAAMGVSQEDKELIVQHIANNITPDDLALIGGAIGTGQPTAATPGGDAAFSAFAKESAERRAHGASDAKSFNQLMKEMQASDTDVAFSTFAQEGAALAAQQAAGGDSGPAAVAANPSNPSSFKHSEYSVFDTKVNAGVVVGKVAEVISSVSSAQVGLEQTAVNAANADSPSVDADRDAIAGLLQLLNAATTTPSKGSRLPVVDLLRLFAARPPVAAAENCLAALSSSNGSTNSAVLFDAFSTTENLSDGEKLVHLRFSANYISLIGKLLRGSPTSLQLASDAATEVLGLAIKLPTTARNNANLASSPKAPVKDAVYALSRNLALLCMDLAATGKSEHAAEAAESILSLVAEALIYESDSKLRLELLGTILTLTEASDALLSVRSREVGTKMLIPAMKALKGYGDPTVVAVARYLFNCFSIGQ